MPHREAKVVGLTGPSSFTSECIEAIEECLECNLVLLYHGKDQNVEHWLKSVDGIILGGGIDVHPTVYNESIWNNNNLKKFDLKRDFRELAIVDYCLKYKKPLLGICRGHQLIGIKLGIGFIMDITNSSLSHNPAAHNITVTKTEPTHAVRIRKEFVEYFYSKYKMPPTPPERLILRNVMKEKENAPRVWVNSFHHQALAFNPKREYEKEGIYVIGTARIDMKVCDEIIEFMQGGKADDRWLSVQWHPEYDWRENSISKVVLEQFKSMLE